MATWLVQHCLSPTWDQADPGSRELPCFRIFPEGEPDRWIVQTNPNLPPEVQKEFALLIAEELSNILGV